MILPSHSAFSKHPMAQRQLWAPPPYFPAEPLSLPQTAGGAPWSAMARRDDVDIQLWLEIVGEWNHLRLIRWNLREIIYRIVLIFKDIIGVRVFGQSSIRNVLGLINCSNTEQIPPKNWTGHCLVEGLGSTVQHRSNVWVECLIEDRLQLVKIMCQNHTFLVPLFGPGGLPWQHLYK